MAEPTISLNFKDIWQDVAEFRYNDRVPAQEGEDWAKRMTNLGYLMFLTERPWRFLSPNKTFTAWADVAAVAGTTVTSSGTTLTASAATFYPEMIGATITIASVAYTIDGYTSTTVVTISSDPSAVAVTFAITGAGSCRMPDNFFAMIDHFRWATSESYTTPIHERSAAWIRAQWAGDTVTTGPPQFYAIEPITYAAATGLRQQAIFWPIPNSTYSFTYACDLAPAKMTSDSEYPLGGPLHGLSIRQAALAKAEEDMGETDGAMHRLYASFNQGNLVGGMLLRSVTVDDRMRARNLGYNGDQEPTTWATTRELVEIQ